MSSDLKNALDNYFSSEKTDFAFLVTGEWGVGKTFQTREYLKENKIEYCYISLFGIDSISGIYSEVFLSTYKFRSGVKRILDLIPKSISYNGLSIPISSISDGIQNSLLKIKVNKDICLIFDDIERSSLNVKDVLGVINHYLDHDCKAIVLSHDVKISEELTGNKEKVFGKTINLYPNTNSALDDFLDIKNGFITSHDKIVIDYIFTKSGCKSLRVLKNSIIDCNLLLSLIDEDRLVNPELRKEIIVFFMCFSINYRSGFINEYDLSNRVEIFTNFDRDDVHNRERREHINGLGTASIITFYNDLLTNKILYDSIVRGVFNKDEINDAIRISRPLEIMSNRPWNTIINFYNISIIEVNESIKDMINLISDLEITEKGEVLHSFTLLFMLSQKKHINYTFDDVMYLFVNYMRFLQIGGFVKPYFIEDFIYPETGSYGYSYWDIGSNKLKEILDIYEKNQKIALYKRYPEYISKILSLVLNDQNSFTASISYRHGVKGEFANIPILSKIKFYNFVDTWLSLDDSKWHEVKIGLYIRYSNGALQNTLQEEHEWYKKVNDFLRYRANQELGLKKDKILRLIA